MTTQIEERSPELCALAVIWVVGIYAVIFRFLLIALGLKLEGSRSPEQLGLCT